MSTERTQSKSDAEAKILANWNELSAALERFNLAKPDLSPELQSDLYGYLCVRMAGFLEQMAFTAIDGLMHESTSGHARAFAISWFYKAPNLTSEAFVKLMDRFGPPLSTDFRDFLADELRSNKLGGLMQVRNAVAHGKNHNSPIKNLNTYETLVKDTYDWFKQKVLI